jgi:drug/metabolite transporter (DMT)-like permease
VKAWFYIVTTGVLFGFGGLATKYVIEAGVDPVLTTALIMTITAVSSIPVYVRTGGVDRRGWTLGMLAGVAPAGGPAILFNLGFERLPASINTLIISLGPVFTAICAHYLLADDRFTSAKTIGLVSSVAGVGLLAGSLETATPAAMLLPLVGAAASGAGFLLVKKVASMYRPATTLFPMMAGAALTAMTATALTNRWEGVPARSWWVLVALGSTGVVAFGAILAAAEIAPASQTALSGYLIPIIGVLGGVLLYDEPFTWRLAAGALLVLAGVVLVGSKRANPGLVTLSNTDIGP